MSKLFSLEEQVAIVTGGSRGIGLAIARTLLTQGARVVVNGHNHAETQATVEVLEGGFTSANGAPRVTGLSGDVADPGTASALVGAALDVFGRLDHLVCNAGIDIIKPAVDYEPDEWDRVVEVNLRGAFLPAQAAARHWLTTGAPGSITMTSSIAGAVGVPTLAPYAASKGGVNQLVRTLAAEWAVHGIRVNAVAPGYVANIMNSVTAHNEPASDERINTFTPLGRRGTVEEIAAPYAFLASQAASYVTGCVLAADGGYTAM